MSDAFIDELQNKKQELTQALNGKKSELFQMDSEQRKLAALLESEKHSSNGHDKKSKNHAPSKDIRTDIQKNELKFKETGKKLDELRKAVHHLEDELKSVNHDLQVVNMAA